mgnify:CR=1 FL=1
MCIYENGKGACLDYSIDLQTYYQLALEDYKAYWQSLQKILISNVHIFVSSTHWH